MIDTLLSYDWIEWSALLFGILYAIFSALNKPVCWVFGMISCALIAIKDFTDYGLLFDGYLQLVYVYMGIVGLYRWINPKKEISLPIRNMSWWAHINGILLCLFLGVVMGFMVASVFNPRYAIIDAITTISSIWATWLLVNRIYENWIYWIIIDIIYVWIFYRSGAELIAILYVIYTITAISGLILWSKFRKNPSLETQKV